MWKTKKYDRGNGSLGKSMICQNSNPSESKWNDYAPENGKCGNWVEVGDTAVAALCPECTSRSVHGLKS